jgi:diguanylate cyclase (GGDEF)-like protein
MYGLSPDQVKPGITLLEILNARIAAGSCPVDADKYISERLDEAFLPEPGAIINELRDGRILAISRRSMPDGGSVAIHQDITTQKNLERELLDRTAALNESNSRFAAALQNMSQGLSMFDASQELLVANERYGQFYELPDWLLKPGTHLRAILEYRAAHGNLRGHEPAIYIETHLHDPTEIQELGNGRVILILRHRLSDGSWLTTHEDITERRRNETRVAFLAHHDALTGLANRAALVEKMTDACARLRRFGEPFSVFILDLDKFKQVNDTYGHHAGDDLLQQVAVRLKSSLRETDVFARLGGDEFAIIQPGEADPLPAADALANRIIGLLAEPFAIEGNDVVIGTSIGIALAPEHGNRPEDLLKMADLALYQTKAHGRNNYTFFEPALGEAATARHLLESEMRRAILQNEFEVLYQPIVDSKTLQIRSAEALVRWRHPHKGLILPGEFIPLAEETGLIAQIGERVLQAACTEAMNWPASVKVAVNISPVQLRNASLLDFVMCVLVESGLPPERLELEITETALIENGAACLSLLRQFKNLGVAIALDDFGTGYSSLSQLTMFPVSRIKIDKSFTQNMTKRADCAAVISAVLALAHSLDIATTAEGVETKEQLRLLSMAGVSSVQGYLIKRPGPAAELDFQTAGHQGTENAA